MKRILAALILGAALAGGCVSTNKPLGVDPTASKSVQVAQSAIVEGYVLIAGVAKTVETQKKAGIITAAERDVFVAQLDDMFAKLVAAESLLADGRELLVAEKTALVRMLVVALERELAKKVGKQ